MSSNTSMHSLQEDYSSKSSSTLTRLKIAIGVVLALAVLAAVGVCAAVITPLVASSSGNQLQQDGDTSIDMETKAKLLDINKEVGSRVASITRRQGNRRPQQGVNPCFSELTNESYPAARIVGRGFRWETTPEPSTPNNPVEELEGYENNWFCDYNENHYAYVDGGMNFTQSDKKLHVPVCGYYYISSQIYFQINNNTRNNTQYAFHEIKVNRNCPQNRPDMVTLKSYSSLGALSEEARFSTYIGDIVKMCTGGTIEVAISKINPCCPYGTNSYVAAHLVAETSCDWKPKKLMP